MLDALRRLVVEAAAQRKTRRPPGRPANIPLAGKPLPGYPTIIKFVGQREDGARVYRGLDPVTHKKLKRAYVSPRGTD